jgi:ABC-type uncharacterized transport system permease subunit
MRRIINMLIAVVALIVVGFIKIPQDVSAIISTMLLCTIIIVGSLPETK